MEWEVSALLGALEELSRGRPDRVLRLRGQLAVDGEGRPVDAPPGADLPLEPFELLIFRGFSSSVTHPTAFDPDRPGLPAGARIATAELLAGPLDPQREHLLGGPEPPEAFLSPAAW
ncbi:MAG: hypothetical protein ACO3ZD_11355 [Cyanobium sp.]|jgi:hypothetical protein